MSWLDMVIGLSELWSKIAQRGHKLCIITRGECVSVFWKRSRHQWRHKLAALNLSHYFALGLCCSNFEVYLPEMFLWVSLIDLLLFDQALLFNPAKPFWRGTGSQNADVELMTDCFVSCFRINPHNNQHFKVNWKESFTNVSVLFICSNCT